MFFTFDGMDGVGKSTQLDMFCQWLEAQGRQVVRCRDPGSTPLGEAVRDILLRREELRVDPAAEMFLYMAARAQLVDEVIRPALDDGKTVVADRYLLANIVYQGYAGGLDVEAVRQVGQVAIAGVEPDLTLLLDMPPEAAAARMTGRPDRMEKRGDEHRRRLREGYLAEAARRPDRIRVIDAAGSVEQVAVSIRSAVEPVLKG